MSTAVLTTSTSETDSESPTRHVRMGDLHTHPGQMRTVYDPVAMVSLMVQVLQAGGIADWQPIVATPRPHADGYYIVSGHRRRMALLFSWALLEGGDPAQDSPSSEAVQTFLDTLLAQHTTIEAAATALLATPYADRLVSIHLFAGDLKEQILALQRANYGADTPDSLGIAQSFHAALEAGASERQIAQNAGQSLAYVKKHLALLRIPLELAEVIANGTLPLSLAETVAEVQPEAARLGMARFILANLSHITVEGIRACVSLLKAWSQFRTPPMSVAHQGQRNMIRLLVTLWDRALAEDATGAWASAVLLHYRNVQPHAPWENQGVFTEWVKALGGATYHNDQEGIVWGALVRDCLTEVECPTCPLHTLPMELLSRDLSDRAGVLGRPCRTLERNDYTRCINGFAPGDPLEVRVPFEWATHPGVTKQGSHYVVISVESLQQAWLAQQAAEDGIPPEESESPAAVTEAQVPLTPVAATPSTARSATGTVDPSPAAPKGPTPVEEMRTLIRDYMTRHTDFDWQHPFATPCGTCQHHLTQSPTKDPTVPPCAWAARLRTVRFTRLVAEENLLTIPVCGQYAPTWTWQDQIPVRTGTIPFPRDYMLAQIRSHAKAAKTHASHPPFEFLTGRPLGSDPYGNWFETQLTEAAGHLSDAQLFTLLVWSVAEYDRASRTPSFWLSRDKHLTTFIPVREIPWS